jgi:hypothetical protein
MHRKRVNVSHVLAGQRVGIEEVDERICIVSLMQYDLGYIDLEQKALQPLDNPFGSRRLQTWQDSLHGESPPPGEGLWVCDKPQERGAPDERARRQMEVTPTCGSTPAGVVKGVVGRVGFEPTTNGSRVWPRRAGTNRAWLCCPSRRVMSRPIGACGRAPRRDGF